MRIVVVQHDMGWPGAYARASDELPSAIGPNLLKTFHIGSTSIPGMHAKPIIDMLAVVSDLKTLDQRKAQMESLGYEAMGEFGIPGRRYFRRNNGEGIRTHQIHAFRASSKHILRHLAFRDFLRAHPVEAREYAELKQRLAAEHPDDMEAYMDGKDAFIKKIQRQAVKWMRKQTN